MEFVICPQPKATRYAIRVRGSSLPPFLPRGAKKRASAFRYQRYRLVARIG